nr:unnamed protein product [Callosobruchus chinensis]
MGYSQHEDLEEIEDETDIPPDTDFFFGKQKTTKIEVQRALRVPLLTARHHTARLQWARAHQDCLLPQWRNVLFSDESRFGLVSDDYRERVWRERGGQNRLATAIGAIFNRNNHSRSTQELIVAATEE